MARNTAYTDGPIGSVMLKTALSMLPGTLAISGYNIVDTYFVSKLGTLPMAAKRVGFDPAVMASPFITTIVDALSLLVYFGIASALLF